MACPSVPDPLPVRRSAVRVARCLAVVAIALLLLPGTLARAGGEPGDVSLVEDVPDGACPTPNPAAWEERLRALEAPGARALHAWVDAPERWALREEEWVEASGELEGEAARVPAALRAYREHGYTLGEVVRAWGDFGIEYRYFVDGTYHHGAIRSSAPLLKPLRATDPIGVLYNLDQPHISRPFAG